MRFGVLGPVEVHPGDGRVLTLPRRQERCLLAVLLLEAGHVVPAARLCELLWEEEPPAHALQALRSYASRIRAMLARAGADQHGVSLVSERGGYLLTVRPDAVDAHRFRRLLDRAAQVGGLTERDRLLRAALALWRGPALQNAAGDRVRQRLCAELDGLRLHAVEECMAVGLDLGRHRELIPELARLTGEHPLRERLAELCMLALHRAGRTADALGVYARIRARLAEQLGLEPGPTLRELHRTILRQEPLPAASQLTATRQVVTGVIPAQLPADLFGFAGRGEPLRRLDAVLAGVDGPAGTAVVISAISGTAGVGKTALAVHWAHRVRDRFPDGQLHVNLHGFDPLGTPIRPGEAIRRFLDALDVPAHRIPTDLDAQVHLYRHLLVGKRVLVVLDNARDADQVRPLLPAAPGCLAVVTSRNELRGLVAAGDVHPFTLDLLDPGEARQLLTARLGADRVDAEPRAVDDIIDLCARLPLALAITAARAATQPRSRLAAFAAELRDTRTRLDALTGDDTATDIRAVFSWTCRALSPAAGRLFRLLGLHPGHDIGAPAAASLAGIPPDQVGPLLAELTRAHLVTEHSAGRFTVHDLLRTYAREQADSLDTEAERRGAVHRLLDHYLHTAHTGRVLLRPDVEPLTLQPPQADVTPEQLADYEQALAWFTAEHAVLLAAVDHAATTGFDTHTRQLAWTLVTFLDRRGHWHDMEAVQRAAVEVAGRLADPAVQAGAHRGLAGAYAGLGRYHDSLTQLQRCVALYSKAGDRTGLAHIHRNIADVHSRLGDDEQALRHAQESLDLYLTLGHRYGQARALNALGWYRSRLGDHPEALTCCTQALGLLEELGDRRGQAGTWDSLGHAHHHLGHHAESVACYQRALDLFQDLGDRFFEAEVLGRLGEVHHAAGYPDAARADWCQALTILDELDHPDAENIRTRLDRLDHPEIHAVATAAP